MKKISKLLLGVAALGLAACSNEEPAPNGGNNNVATGDVAYLNITIKSAEDAAGSRATTGEINNGSENVEYIYGDQGENNVTSAHFYFYDEAGKFVLQADKWTNGTTGSTENVEIIGDNTVILENMTGKTYPTWMVTVLNQPANFKPGATLDDMEKIVIDSWNSGNESAKFIMTTSSYFGNENKNGNSWNYFATKLKPENFYQQTPDQETIPAADRVQVYVERLAVRVGVDVVGIQNEKLSDVTYEETAAQGVKRQYPLYRVDASVGGEGNGNIGEAAATKLYVAITGWELTSTAKRTNFVKNLTGWNNTTTFGGTKWLWNDGDKDNHGTGDNDGYHRSYWGKSTTYGLSGTALTTALNVQNAKWEKLNQIVGTEVFNGTRLYCNENTNEPANITDNGSVGGTVDPSKTTTVMLRAVVCDETGAPVQLVRYLGLNFVQSQFVLKALEKVSPVIYTRTDTGEKYADGTTKYTYDNITPEYLAVVSNAAAQGTGAVKLTIADEKKDVEYFILSGNETYDYKYTEGDVEHTVTITKPNAIAKTLSEVNAYLATATAGTNNIAIGYKDGASYYPICIAHLNQPAAKGDIIEGQFGVVRNHVYNIRISKIKTLGEGVFVPRSENGQEAEVITPAVKDPTYYVESNINILSWKVVSQLEEI